MICSSSFLSDAALSFSNSPTQPAQQKRTSRPSYTLTTAFPMLPSFSPETGHTSKRYGAAALSVGFAAGGDAGLSDPFGGSEAPAATASDRAAPQRIAAALPDKRTIALDFMSFNPSSSM